MIIEGPTTGSGGSGTTEEMSAVAQSLGMFDCRSATLQGALLRDLFDRGQVIVDPDTGRYSGITDLEWLADETLSELF